MTKLTWKAMAALTGLGGMLAAAPAPAHEDPDEFGGFLTKKAREKSSRNYEETVRKTAGMVGDSRAHELVGRFGLDLLNLTWEDTGRFKGSAVGPNISDMTIQVGVERGRGQVERVLMPVMRFPNFSDKTGDMDPRDFTLLVGNERGRQLRRVSLYDFLASPDLFLSRPGSWPARNKSLLAERDSKVLVSAQACFLPVPQSGKATFNPVLFNYQSSPGNPAVLTILATREGTSTAIVENRLTDGQWNWGQTLFFNSRGQRASFTGERMSDWVSNGRQGQGSGDARVSDEALNMVLLIQVPLRHQEPRGYKMEGDTAAAPANAMGGAGAKSRGSDVENAVIGHGELEGPFTEMNGQPVERDPRYPVRVTVQFYKATSNGVISEADARQVGADIARVYDAADSVGSLVTDGHTGRVTEYDGCKVQPAGWWNDFWTRYESYSGVPRESAVRKLRKMMGDGYLRQPVSDLYLRDCLRG